METILVLVHGDENSALTKGSLEAVTAGKELAARLGTSFAIGAIGAECAPLGAVLAGCDARILAATAPELASPRYSTDAAACEALCRSAGATIVLAPGSSRFARVAAGIAYRLGGVVDTHVMALGGSAEIEATRWFYRQRIEAVLSRSTRPWILLLESGCRMSFAAAGEAPTVEEVAINFPASRSTVTGFRTPAADEQTIRPDAKVLFVAGAGWTKKQPDGQMHAADAAGIILKFLARSGASLGSSKSLVDQGGDGQPVLPFLSHMNQIGQTGATPRHPKGLSTCCHGEEPHVVGWRFIGERRAISLDPNCGWTRGKADVVYIADAFRVMQKLNALLE